MIHAARDHVARAVDAELDKATPTRTTVPREERLARRADVARVPSTMTALPDREPLHVAMPLSSGVSADPVLIAAMPPLAAPIAAAAVPALETTPSSGVIAEAGTAAANTVTSTPDALARPGVDQEEQAVWRTLTRYVAAFEQMNIGATVAVWPSVDQRALARAFGTLKSQGLAFDACDVDVQRTTATARCSGTVRFVPKVGSGDAQVAAQAWLFSMRRAGRDWTIDEVRASRVTGW